MCVNIYFSLSRERVLVLIICASNAAVLEHDLLMYLLFVQFLGGRDTVKLCAGQGKLMGEPCA